ncbi:transcription factor [Ophiostoma piceae UAMH 11346]|uniref:Transcription factor n=1 Tax=Ophiostoma piceae (strain UAMH 11346) TaxID=1262450 RepID=S3CDD2_OPHP1|nr:transcription factor [Ophiostoma piceae UAMH 11346]
MASAADRSGSSGITTPALGTPTTASAPQTVTPADIASANATPSSSPGHTGNGSDTSSPSAVPPFRQNGHKSCDACKMRKVKCPITKHLRFAQPCTAQNEASPSTMLCYVDAPGTDGSSGSPRPSVSVRDTVDLIPSLYVDHMLAQAQTQAQTRGKEATFVKGNGIFGGSYSLTFFSEARLLSLSTRLRNNKVNELVRRINGIVSGRLRRSNEPSISDVAASSHRCSSSSTTNAPTLSISSVMEDPPPMLVDPEFAASCIHYYFERVHRLYPFLDRAAFEARALPAPGSGEEGEKALAWSLARSKAWSSLYYTVVAIGGVYSEGAGSGATSANTNNSAAGAPFLETSANMPTTPALAQGSFEPGKGTAWRLFSMALVNLSDLLILPDSLLTLQALTAMVVYGLGVSCLSIERVILSEASRRAQSLASTFGTSTSGSTTSSATFQRTFWVLYSIEKVMSFHFGRSSTFVDSDIACPIPSDMGSGSDSLSCAASSCWFLLMVRHSRLLSRTYSSLFSVGTVRVTTANNLATIDRLCDEVEEWRLAIPSTRGLRPECSSWRGSNINGVSDTRNGNGSNKTSMALRSTNLTERTIALALRFLYHSVIVILARAKLHHLSLFQSETEKAATDASEQTLADMRAQEIGARRSLMTSARGILELTPFIDVEPYMPLWVLAVIPLTALFVLFDLVVDHPGDTAQNAQNSQSTQSGPRTISSDTALNLALLDMGAGYFSRIEYASNSSLPGSLISEFAHIARDYVNDYQRGVRSVHAPLPPPPPPPPEHTRRGSQDDDSTDGIHSIPMLQPTTRIIPQSQPEQRPLPSPPPLMTQPQQQNQQEPQHQQHQQPSTTLPTTDHQQMNLLDPSSLAGWPPSSVPGQGVAVASTSDGSMPLVGDPNAANFADGLGYGFGTNPYQPGGADFSGTDVMGLFTSHHYFLSEMDGILYNGL